jgi:exonuclease III
MRFGTWNVRSLYRSGSFTTVTREWTRYKLDLMGVQEVRWDKGDIVRTGDLKFSRKRIENLQLGTGFFVHHRIASVVKREEFVSDRMPYRLLRGRCFESACNK